MHNAEPQCVQFREHFNYVKRQKFLRGMQVPCLKIKVFCLADCPQMYTPFPHLNFSVSVPILQNKVVREFIWWEIFSGCQELSLDLKVAHPIDQKFGLRVKSTNFKFCPNFRNFSWAWGF